MKMFGFNILLVIISTISSNEAYRILGVFPLNGKSHFVMFEQLMKGLAKRGHQVDVVSHFPLKKPFPNYSDVVDLSGTIPAVLNNMTYDFVKSTLVNSAVVPLLATQFGGDLCDLMGHPRFRELIKNPPKDSSYDLVITEIFGASCYLALGQHFNVPIVGLSSSVLLPWANDIVANPDNPAYVPNVFSDNNGRMNFFQRVQNALSLWIAKWEFNSYSAYQDDKIQKYLGPNAISLREAERNVSLILANSHYSLHGIRPYTTAVVEVGGLHIPQEVDALPKDLQKWLDDSRDGFVYMSFGSMIKIESFPKETLAALYNSLHKLAPVRVLIKIAKPQELPPGLPSNVLTLSWVPQVPVLKHKHVRAFVTHGGLMGTQEAIYCGVPMIGIPLFGDQMQNIKLYVQKKIAVALEPDQLTEEKLDTAFRTVLGDPSYLQAAKKFSIEFRDRPMSAMDTATFWIEYVIRHGGTNLKSPAMDLTWWQISLLDIYGALFLSVAFSVYLVKVIITTLIVIVTGSNINSVKQSKKVK
ncbi:UDP-glycosyltransferase UGT5-like [Diprion similis]|uniref:UDP-glycosyltransferase UGT5-like n=1 Tax=Diprion similis TaxID=362088 RepID=UPI001EF8D512|nr:UDP-glycosyltransferase UGT5-like [Diprion similis]